MSIQINKTLHQFNLGLHMTKRGKNVSTAKTELVIGLKKKLNSNSLPDDDT